MNPYRPVDADYESFIALYVGQLAAGLANAQAYAAERRRAEALAQIDRAKTTFFSNVSHEFRTPLTLMQAPVEDLLKSPDLSPSHREQLVLVHRNALRLQKLVNTLLDFSRIEAGRVQPFYEPTDLAELTASLASAFRSATDRAGLTLVVDCAPIGELVYVDRDMWEKVVLNLVSNAFKFTLEGQIRDRPAARRRRRGAHGAGHGERNSRGRAPVRVRPVSPREPGRGGGRTRARESAWPWSTSWCKLHGGNVVVQSELDRGSTFTVTVPLGTAHLAAEARRSSARLGVHRAWRATAFVEEAMRWLPGSRVCRRRCGSQRPASPTRCTSWPAARGRSARTHSARRRQRRHARVRAAPAGAGVGCRGRDERPGGACARRSNGHRISSSPTS